MIIQYTVINKEGKTFSGTMQASSSREATRILQQQGEEVISLKEEAKSRENRYLHRLTPEILSIFIKQLVSLLQSNVSIDEALSSLEEAETNVAIKKACSQMLRTIRNGASFSTALISANLPLPPYFYLLAQAGEITGTLGKAMHSGLKQWEYNIKTRKRFISTLIYPSILVFTGIAAILLIFLLVVPRFASILSKSDKDIPLLTKIVLVPGTFFNNHLWLVAAIFFGLFILMVIIAQSHYLRRRLLGILSELPLLSLWMQEIELNKWATMVATLLKSRVELTVALDLAAQFVSGYKQQQFQQLTTAVRSGASLSTAISDKQIMPATAINLIRVGEKTGDLAAMLATLAQLTENSIKSRTGTLLSIIEPVAILLIGSVIGLIMAGLIMGIVSINEII